MPFRPGIFSNPSAPESTIKNILVRTAKMQGFLFLSKTLTSLLLHPLHACTSAPPCLYPVILSLHQFVSRYFFPKCFCLHLLLLYCPCSLPCPASTTYPMRPLSYTITARLVPLYCPPSSRLLEPATLRLSEDWSTHKMSLLPGDWTPTTMAGGPWI